MFDFSAFSGLLDNLGVDLSSPEILFCWKCLKCDSTQFLIDVEAAERYEQLCHHCFICCHIASQGSSSVSNSGGANVEKF